MSHSRPGSLGPTERLSGGALSRTRRRGERFRGFTILEIMIATAILTLGLVSVLALFPVAIHTGKQVMENSSAVVIAESVAEAIREGIANQPRSVNRSGATDRYFIFKHDGVKDSIPNDKTQEKPRHDYYILLPRFAENRNFSGRTESDRREKAVAAAKTFVYPESDPSPNGGGSADLADDDGDDYKGVFSNGRAYKDIRVTKTYPLGTLLPDVDQSGAAVLADQQIEPLKQYSFAFAVRASKYDSNHSPNDQAFLPANRLYNFRVMVFRSFMPPAPEQKHDEPVFELHFEVVL